MTHIKEPENNDSNLIQGKILIVVYIFLIVVMVLEYATNYLHDSLKVAQFNSLAVLVLLVFGNLSIHSFRMTGCLVYTYLESRFETTMNVILTGVCLLIHITLHIYLAKVFFMGF